MGIVPPCAATFHGPVRSSKARPCFALTQRGGTISRLTNCTQRQEVNTVIHDRRCSYRCKHRGTRQVRRTCPTRRRLVVERGRGKQPWSKCFAQTMLPATANWFWSRHRLVLPAQHSEMQKQTQLEHQLWGQLHCSAWPYLQPLERWRCSAQKPRHFNLQRWQNCDDRHLYNITCGSPAAQLTAVPDRTSFAVPDAFRISALVIAASPMPMKTLRYDWKQSTCVQDAQRSGTNCDYESPLTRNRREHEANTYMRGLRDRYFASVLEHHKNLDLGGWRMTAWTANAKIPTTQRQWEMRRLRIPRQSERRTLSPTRI